MNMLFRVTRITKSETVRVDTPEVRLQSEVYLQQVKRKDLVTGGTIYLEEGPQTSVVVWGDTTLQLGGLYSLEPYNEKAI